MAVCRTCERVLSANGSCLFCGTGFGKSAVPVKGAGKRANWVRRILLLLLAALLVHFFFISPTGRQVIRPLLETIGLVKDAPT